MFDDDLGPGQALILHRSGGVPDVLADRDADASAGNVEELHAGPRAEVTRLVEHAVVGQILLVIGARQLAAVNHRRSVKDVVRIVDEPDDGSHV